MARPRTGQTPVKAFRPPSELWARLESIAARQERTPSQVLIQAMHDYVTREERAHRATSPTDE